MERYIGIDLHKKSFTVAELLYPDYSVRCFEVALDDPQSIQKFLDGLRPSDKAAVEATANSYFLYELLKPFVSEVVIADPKKVRPIAESNSKTDMKDAEILARMLLGGLLQGICVPPPEVRAARGLLRHRLKQVGEKTSVKNRVHALLGLYGFTSPVSDLFGRQGRNIIEEMKNLLPSDAEVELVSCMRLIDFYEEEIKKLDEHLTCIALADPYVELLMTIRGMNVITAMSISSYIVDIARFPSDKKLAAYAGIVPIVRNSNGKVYHGSITKGGPPVFRWALIEVTQSLVKEDGPFRNLYRRILRKRGDSKEVRGKAIVACANKLARVIWHMLTGKKTYNEYNTSLYDRKIKKLRKVAKPYPHTLEEKWDAKFLTPSIMKLPYLDQVEDPEVTRFLKIQEIVIKSREKKKRSKKKKAA